MLLENGPANSTSLQSSEIALRPPALDISQIAASGVPQLQQGTQLEQEDMVLTAVSEQEGQTIVFLFSVNTLYVSMQIGSECNFIFTTNT